LDTGTMTLRTRMTLATAALILSVLVLLGVSLWAVVLLTYRHGQTYAEYEELRLIERVGQELARTRGMMDAPYPNPVAISRSIERSLGFFDSYLAMQRDPSEDGTRHEEDEMRTLGQMAGSLRNVIDYLTTRGDHWAPGDSEKLAKEADALLVALETLVSKTNQQAQRARARALAVSHAATVALIVTALAVAVGGVWLCVVQYHSVIRPLRRIQQSANLIASGRLSERVEVMADRELAELARDFNTMAGELEGVYRDLEQRVEVKSRQLVRSERLASVGYLAAGVAHEINNPLSIIAGYAEMTLNRVRKLPVEQVNPDLAEAMQIIQEEAFRCKQITSKLLSLTRQDSSPPQPVSLARAAQDMRTLIAGLPQFRDRRLELDLPPDDALIVMAREPEIKQVLLNLAVNALEATTPGEGVVRLEGRTAAGRVSFSVIDNGRGMSPDVLPHVFEPFFSQKRGAGEPGTGLGLSIVHAIVIDNGGEIEAHSDGPGCGSRFTLRLPAQPQESASHVPTASSV
jgi:signal transduction histidine kinase